MAKPTTRTSLTVTHLRPALTAALRAWRQMGATIDNRLTQLELIRDRQAAIGGEAGSAVWRRAANEVLLDGLDELAAADPRGAQILRARYLDAQLTKEVANRLNASVDQVNRLQRSALQQLTEILIRREQTARDARVQQLEAAFPPAQYHHLYGFDGAAQILEQQILKPEAPWVVTVTGLGGIGKTALADSVARRLIRLFHFERIFWWRADPGEAGASPAAIYDKLLQALALELWPSEASAPLAGRALRVQQAFKAHRYLVVVDNLESDAQTAYFLENLAGLTAPSKFLVTTRARIAAANAFALSPEELNRAEAEELIRDQAALVGLSAASAITPVDLQAIYHVVGGNPLALKLVVSLAAVQPLMELLADLEQARTGPTEDLYRRIYWRAWQSLTVEARALLQAMPLVAEVGAAPDHLLAISGLAEARLWPAITELWSQCLLEVRGSLHDKRYGIHRLTESFLRTEIIHWPETGRP